MRPEHVDQVPARQAAAIELAEEFGRRNRKLAPDVVVAMNVEVDLVLSGYVADDAVLDDHATVRDLACETRAHQFAERWVRLDGHDLVRLEEVVRDVVAVVGANVVDDLDPGVDIHDAKRPRPQCTARPHPVLTQTDLRGFHSCMAPPAGGWHPA